MQITVTNEMKDKITEASLRESANLCAEEIVDLLDELIDGGHLEQYKLKDLNDSARTLEALLTVIKYCTVSPQLSYHEEVLAEYEDAIYS